MTKKRKVSSGKGKRRSPRTNAKPDGSSEVAFIRSIEALKLRCAGASYYDIGQAMDISKTQAYKDVQGLLDSYLEEAMPTIDKLRALENLRLDMALQKVLPNIVNTQPDANGMVEMTDDFKSAVWSFIRISHVRIRLNGLEPPKQAPLDPDGNAVPANLTKVINVLNVIRQENEPAYKAFVAVTANGVNGGIEIKPKRIKGGRKKK